MACNAAAVPVIGAPIAFVVVSIARKRRTGDDRGSGSGSGGGRHSGGGKPDPRFAYAPDPRFGAADIAFPPGAVAATSVLASTGPPTGASLGSFEAGSAPATSGDPFPTTGRAMALLGGTALTGFGFLILLLSAKPTGHHEAHVGNGAIGFLGLLIAFDGASFSVPATGRIQRDVIGGGWNSRVALGYISSQISLYVISPAGISAIEHRARAGNARHIRARRGRCSPHSRPLLRSLTSWNIWYCYLRCCFR